MAIIKCPECNHEVSDQAEKCPHCGVGVRKPDAVETGASLISLVVAIIVIIFGVIAFLSV